MIKERLFSAAKKIVQVLIHSLYNEAWAVRDMRQPGRISRLSIFIDRRRIL